MIAKITLRKLRELYLDEEVVLYLRDMHIIATDSNDNQLNISPMISGYVVDIDQDYFYLGLPDGTVLKTVPHDSVGLIEIFLTAEEVLDMNLPEPDEEVH